MTTNRSRPNRAEPLIPPAVFPIWPGVCAAMIILVVCLVASELVRSLSRSIAELGGGVMSIVHAMTAFAAITLIGEAMTLSVWEHKLADLRDKADSGDARIDFLDDPEPEEQEAAREGIRRADLENTSRLQSLLKICLVPAYLAPLIGFALTLSAASSTRSWFERGGPLFLSLFESGLVMLLSLGVSYSARGVRLGWLALNSDARPQE